MITISAQQLYSVGLYLLFVGGTMSYIRYLCLFVHSGVLHILRCVFALFLFVLCLLHVALDCPFLIALRCSLTYILPSHDKIINTV